MNALLVNEHKGILLSLILWISKNQSKLSNKSIKINLSKYLTPLIKLFPNLNFSTNSMSNQKTFDIQIQSQLLGDLNIGFIYIYSKINAKKVYLAPWSDAENPIVMFLLDKKKQDIKKIKNQITEYNIKSNLNEWSIKMEEKVLDLYFRSSNVYTSIDKLKKYVESLFSQVIIKKKSELKNLVMPNYIPNFIPIVFSTDYRKQIEQIKEMIEKKENKYKNLNQQTVTANPETIYLPCPNPNINMDKEIRDLREIIELLNGNIKMLEENTTMAINPVQDGGSKKVGGKKLDMLKLLSRAIKLSNKYKIKFLEGHV